MSMMGVASGHDLAEHFNALGCNLSIKMLNFSVHTLAHVEDAGLGTLSWYRGDLPSGFGGDVLVAGGNHLANGAARLVAYHKNPRMVLGETISRFGFDELVPKITKGPGCRIHASAVLGADGQGYDRVGDRWEPFPHAGGLWIGPDVDVGPCATIMRGSIGNTVIESGSKIGNGVNIGHDTRIGKRVLVVAGAQIAGWVRIGDDAKIWQGAILKNGIRIGAGAQIGMGAVVTKDVPAGEVWAGNPAGKVR